MHPWTIHPPSRISISPLRPAPDRFPRLRRTCASCPEWQGAVSLPVLGWRVIALSALRTRRRRRAASAGVDELRDVLCERLVRRRPSVNHVTGLVVAVRHAIGDLLVVREMREVEL